jgi:hypothetical protein
MSDLFSVEEIDAMCLELAELKREHRRLDETILLLLNSTLVEELKIKRLKKQKLHLKDRITQLEDNIIPDILA